MKYLCFVFLGILITVLMGVFLLPGTRANAEGRGEFMREQHAPVCVYGEGVRCHTHVVIDEFGKAKAKNIPQGYGPAQFLSAYNLTGVAPSHKIIAIVDAFDHPSILSDLNVYSGAFGIPKLPACSGPISASAVPCFQKSDQRGGNAYPVVNAGWALEIALDVEVAHAVCQNCSILLVEADNNQLDNLMAGIDQAVAMGATVVSNSWGLGEFSNETEYDVHLNHPGVAITFSSGDSGFGTSYPAASSYVTAVGGTTLNLSDNAYGNETVWGGAGSGCSAYEAKPIWQTDLLCAGRTVADVSADADPSTGAAVYDSIRYQGRKGWFKVGGTSLSAPIIAGVYALAGDLQSSVQGNSLPYIQFTPSNSHDITTGSNGICGGTYLCNGTAGYDGPTGLGTPNGVGGF